MSSTFENAADSSGEMVSERTPATQENQRLTSTKMLTSSIHYQTISIDDTRFSNFTRKKPMGVEIICSISECTMYSGVCKSIL